MGKTIAITQRELNAYFLSPIAYIASTVFLVVTGFFFWLILVNTQELTLRWVFRNMSVILLFCVPMITMRLMSEEMRSGTIEPLTTAPVTEVNVVVGKFLGALIFYIVMILPTGVYAACLAKLGNPDWGPIISGYLGLLLLGVMFVSAGLLFSCFTRSQIAAGIATFVFLLVLWVIGYAVPEDAKGVAAAIKYLGIVDHHDDFVKGMIDTRDIIYYIANSAVFLFVAVKVVESTKWR